MQIYGNKTFAQIHSENMGEDDKKIMAKGRKKALHNISLHAEAHELLRQLKICEDDP